MAKFAIGIDFGTLSGRALLIDVKSGETIAESVKEYEHGVMDTHLPDGTALGLDWALQHPQDYIDVIATTVPDVIRAVGIDSRDVIGLGIDFTACTMLPVFADGTPLCMLPEFAGEPHAYVKLWKHHAAQKQANRINELAEARGEAFLARYGGKISSEWFFPKMLQTLEEAPHVYVAADLFLEAADWVNFRLTGVMVRNSCTAGYKAIWNKREGYPDKSFLRALDPRLEHVIETKMRGSILPIGRCQGYLTPEIARLTGLTTEVAVSVANVDAHVSLPAVGVTGPGKMLMILGTSTCDILLGTEEAAVPGMCGVVEDGVVEGYFGFEAGQSCVGDHFNWFVDHAVPASYLEDAKRLDRNIHDHLTTLAAALHPGESGLVALDWWNGNRSVLVDADLTGMMLGMTLRTKPEEQYRALIEATAYGTRMIVETFTANGVPIDELYACGGIAWKNPLFMQIYADVTNRVIRISASKQTPALGAAMFGAVAAGSHKGGYDSIVTASAALGKVKEEAYHPRPDAVAIYDKLFEEYRKLHDYFGRGGNDCMKRLKEIKEEVSRWKTI